MRICLVALLALAAAMIVKPTEGLALEAQDLSYGELARNMVGGLWRAVNRSLPMWEDTPSYCPGDPATLRYNLVYFRDAFSIFAYAYPTTSLPGMGDAFQVMYRYISSGYQMIGQCWDMGKTVGWTQADRKKLIVPLISWKNQFLADIKRYNLSDYATNPSTTKIYLRSKSSLSYQFWGSTSNVPRLDATAKQNFALLGRGQWESCRDRFTTLIAMNNITIASNHEQFHDYRKLIRYAMNFARDMQSGSNNFPNPLNRSISSQLSIGGSLHSKMGGLNDLIVGFYLYRDRGDWTRAQQNLNSINSQWPSLQSWLKANGWGQAVQYVIDSFIKV